MAEPTEDNVGEGGVCRVRTIVTLPTVNFAFVWAPVRVGFARRR